MIGLLVGWAAGTAVGCLIIVLYHWVRGDL